MGKKTDLSVVSHRFMRQFMGAVVVFFVIGLILRVHRRPDQAISAIYAFTASDLDQMCPSIERMSDKSIIDRWLREEWLSKKENFKIGDGVFVEMGAAKSTSNTFWLENCLGWRGYLIGSRPDLQLICKETRKQSECLPAQCGARGAGIGNSDCTTIAAILAARRVKTIDIMSINVMEGAILALSTYDWIRNPVHLILVANVGKASKWKSRDALIESNCMTRIELPRVVPPMSGWINERYPLPACTK